MSKGSGATRLCITPSQRRFFKMVLETEGILAAYQWLRYCRLAPGTIPDERTIKEIARGGDLSYNESKGNIVRVLALVGRFPSKLSFSEKKLRGVEDSSYGCWGLIRSHLVEMGVEKGYSIVAFDRSNPNNHLGWLHESKFCGDIRNETR